MLEEGALFSFVLLLNSESVGYLEILFTEKPYLVQLQEVLLVHSLCLL